MSDPATAAAQKKPATNHRKKPERQREQLTECEIGRFRIVIYIDRGLSAEQIKELCAGNAALCGNSVQSIVSQRGV